MCGFAGLLLNQAGRLDGLAAIAGRMADAIAHRGPDDFGTWADAKAGIALGHRRLSVVELSAAGHQPMRSESGRFVLAFNGEIYNHLDLRAELDLGERWRGHSDTETLLAGFERWGVEPTLTRAVGMFAIALWDVQEGTLHLARDRFGEKPLYYGWLGEGDTRVFAFASELKALRAFPSFGNLVCRQALAQYMRFMYVPAPRSIYQDIYKLEPGCLLSMQGPAPVAAPVQPLRPPALYGSLTLSRWWALADAVAAGAQAPITNDAEAVDALEQRLVGAIQLQSLADVPVGAFLSGGVDSSTIVALMQRHSTRQVKTFTVGFEEAAFDESPYARAVAQHLGTDHAELFVTASEAQAVIPKLPAMYDEPFADASQIPTHLVCAAARQHVTVALSGDAGDELFGGYNRYLWEPRIRRRLAWLPMPARQALGRAIVALPVAGWDALGRSVEAVLGDGRGVAHMGARVHKLAARLRHVRNWDDLYLSLVSEWQDPAQVLCREAGKTVAEPASLLADPEPTCGTHESQLRMMYRDAMTYLPDDVLCKVDRAAMAMSLETRAPFLDHRVAELAWQLPLQMKIRGGEGKWALRQVLSAYVPRALIDRPKAGFGIPIGKWLRGPLRPWAASLLNPQRLQTEGYFQSAPIWQKWEEHLSGTRDHTSALWAVLMFQTWLESVR
jgi:asparagine synthase (glutamine-hydrolysing)